MATEHPRHVIQVRKFRKTYRSTVAVDDISFDVHDGEIFGLIGPNGAGKTTTMECVQGLRTPDRGTISVLGLDPFRLDPGSIATRVNATEGEKEPLSAADEERLVAEYAPDVRLLASLVPDLDLDLWPRFRDANR